MAGILEKWYPPLLSPWCMAETAKLQGRFRARTRWGHRGCWEGGLLHRLQSHTHTHAIAHAARADALRGSGPPPCARRVVRARWPATGVKRRQVGGKTRRLSCAARLQGPGPGPPSGPDTPALTRPAKAAAGTGPNSPRHNCRRGGDPGPAQENSRPARGPETTAESQALDAECQNRVCRAGLRFALKANRVHQPARVFFGPLCHINRRLAVCFGPVPTGQGHPNDPPFRRSRAARQPGSRLCSQAAS